MKTTTCFSPSSLTLLDQCVSSALSSWTQISSLHLDHSSHPDGLRWSSKSSNEVGAQRAKVTQTPTSSIHTLHNSDISLFIYSGFVIWFLPCVSLANRASFEQFVTDHMWCDAHTCSCRFQADKFSARVRDIFSSHMS